MFTREDYNKYFEQIAMTERTMMYRACDILSQINNDSVKTVLEDIGKDELRHYLLVRGTIDVILFRNEAERMKHQRESSLGDIEVSGKGQAKKTDAWCVNISQHGVCMESQEPFNKGDKLELSIKLRDKDEPMNKTGAVIWTHQIQSNLYITGVEFE